MKQLENPDSAQQSVAADGSSEDAASPSRQGSSGLIVVLVILILLVGGAGAYAGYWGWQQFIVYRDGMQSQVQALQARIDQGATQAEVAQQVGPLKQSVGKQQSQLQNLQQQQQELLASTEKLFELYGRDENGWKLAEVDYLMSIAQHKLILEHDFDGAAKTLNAASGMIAELADPGLLPVRVQINDEIARLKTRKRPDLVGMTLLLARLSRQIVHLTPGYQSVDKAEVRTGPTTAPTVVSGNEDQRPLKEQVVSFMKSLVTINRSARVADQPVADVVDVSSKLEDNLKLARWSLLDRDAHQYQRLVSETLELFKQYYDLENAANADFLGSLSELSKAQIKPELPDISGSLILLREIVKKRESDPSNNSEQEAVNHG